ncbi:MAG: hypothetical protein ACTHK0_01670 [Ginsengibacter sp.]
MKKMLLTFVCTVFLLACNENADKANTNGHTDHANVQNADLTLNNGAKWKADSITNHNVVILKTIADNFRMKPFPNKNDYQILSSDLGNGLNEMIRQCKMAGPDHEALHHWLETILQDNKRLKEISDTSNSRQIFNSIDKRIDDYHNYFE